MNQQVQTKIYADAYALSLCIFQRTKAIPKAQRPTLGRGIEESALRVLCSVRAAGVAGAGEARRRACLDASDALDRLRIFTQLSKDLGFFSDVAFFEISERSAEVGRQLGGWLKAARGTGIRPSS